MSEAPASVSILVLEDRVEIQDRLMSLFSAAPGYRLLGIAGSAEDALVLLKKEIPRIFLVDLELPGMSGEELVPIVRHIYPDVRMVVFTVFEDAPRIARLMRLGARGYLLKDISDELLLAELGVILAGGSTLTERVAQKLLAEIEEAPVPSKNPLSERETEVLNLIALGLNYKEIADDLDISPHTVRRHLNHLYEKLEVGSKVEAINRARQLGIFDTSQ